MIELLNTADLHIETNDAGFVLGKSSFGTPLATGANSWREVKGDFSQISLNRPMGIDKSVLFRPEAPRLGLRTVIEDYYEGVFGKSIRIRWKDDVLFIGTIKDATIASRALRDGKDQTTVNVSAIGIIDYINSYRLYNISAPQQTVADRIATIMPPNVTVQVLGGDRTMAAKGQSSPTLMEVLQDAADVAQARFYVNKNNEIIIDATDVPEPTILFSDDPGDTERVLYRSVNTQENATNSITGLVVTAKSDQAQNKVTAIAEHPNPSLKNEQAYEVDVPAEAGALEAWAESFPLQGKAVQSPTSIDCYWQDALADIELTHQVDIKWKENGYRVGIKGINYEMRAERNGKFRWNVKYDLFPGHLLGFDRLNAPSAIKNLYVTGEYIAEVNGYDPTKIVLRWQAPDVPNNFTHYEIRMTRGGASNEPERAPQNQNDGEQIAFVKKEDVPYGLGYQIEGTTYQNGLIYTISDLDQESKYWFTIWAVTANPDVRSPGVSGWQQTVLATPSAPQNFTATFYKDNPSFPFGNFRFAWDDPEDVALRMGRYDIRVSTTNPQPTLADGIAVGSDAPEDNSIYQPYWGDHEAVGYGYDLNTTFYFAIRAKNANGWNGPAAYAVGSSGETVPSPVQNVRHTVNDYNTITVNWDAPATPGNLQWYLVRWDRGGAPGLNSGYLLSRVPSTQRSIVFETGTTGGDTYGFTVWPQTTGLRNGGSGSTVASTPVGIFNRYWEGEAVWSQSYRQNGQFSSLARGNNIDMYYGYGDSFNGNQKSMMGFALPGNLQNCYAVDRVELHMYNKHTWYNTGADAWFGIHHSVGKPGTFQMSQGGMASYRVYKPGWLHVDATWWLANALKGGAKGLTMGPGPNNSNTYYGFAAGVGGPRPVLKVWYRTIG